jgi:hypothetical protein
VTFHLFSSGCTVERSPHCKARLGPGGGRHIPSRRPHQTGGNLGSARRQKGSVSDPDPLGFGAGSFDPLRLSRICVELDKVDSVVDPYLE